MNKKRLGDIMQVPVWFITIGLLVCSNIFMTFAWYGHLKFPAASMWQVVLISWVLAFFEYCLLIPANRVGYGHFNVAELRTIQEVISLSVFMIFTVTFMGESLKWNYIVGFALICAAAFVIFHKW